MISSKEDFVLSIAKFESGTTYNVMPDDAILLGTLRTFNPKVLEAVKAKIVHIAKSTAEAFDCKVEYELNDKYPVVVNHEKETLNIFQIAKKYFGEERVSSKDLPMSGAEDFAYYLNSRPGCFYAIGTKFEGLNYALHSSSMDYNDSMIAPGAYMFIRIIEDRLGVKILRE
jgi:metal-dependent amidase/aminoacylase/carboxypeptidase family protein